MKDDIVRSLLGLLLITVTLGLFVQFVWIRSAKNENNRLKSELVVMEGVDPETITVTETEVIVKYQDRIITKEIPREGFVRFDIGKYRNVITVRDSLKRKLMEAKINLQDANMARMNAERANKNPLLALIDSVGYRETIEDLEREIRALETEALLPLTTTQKEDIIYVRNRGFCFRPLIGVGYSGQSEPIIGVKLLYYKKYGLFAGSTREGAGIGLNRRISDFIPFTKNTSFSIMGTYPYKPENSRIFIGLTTDL